MRFRLCVLMKKQSGPEESNEGENAFANNKKPLPAVKYESKPNKRLSLCELSLFNQTEMTYTI